MNAKKIGFLDDVGSDRANNGRWVSRIKVIGLQNDHRSNFTRLRAFPGMEIGKPYLAMTVILFRLGNGFKFLQHTHRFRSRERGFLAKP